MAGIPLHCCYLLHLEHAYEKRIEQEEESRRVLNSPSISKLIDDEAAIVRENHYLHAACNRMEFTTFNPGFMPYYEILLIIFMSTVISLKLQYYQREIKFVVNNLLY